MLDIFLIDFFFKEAIKPYTKMALYRKFENNFGGTSLSFCHYLSIDLLIGKFSFVQK